MTGTSSSMGPVKPTFPAAASVSASATITGAPTIKKPEASSGLTSKLIHPDEDISLVSTLWVPRSQGSPSFVLLQLFCADLRLVVLRAVGLTVTHKLYISFIANLTLVLAFKFGFRLLHHWCSHVTHMLDISFITNLTLVLAFKFEFRLFSSLLVFAFQLTVGTKDAMSPACDTHLMSTFPCGCTFF